MSDYGKPCLFPHTKRFWTLIHQPSNDLVALLVEDENIDRGIVSSLLLHQPLPFLLGGEHRIES